MKTLKFKLYQSKQNKHLKRSINAAGVIYNHCIALHKRYYRIWGKHLNCTKLQTHIAKLRKRNPFWKLVGFQAVQDICQRIEKAYQLFFKHHKKGVRPPTLRRLENTNPSPSSRLATNSWEAIASRLGARSISIGILETLKVTSRHSPLNGLRSENCLWS